MHQYQVVRGDNGRTVTAFLNGTVYVAGEDNPYFDKIVVKLGSNGDVGNIIDMFTPGKKVERKLNKLSKLSNRVRYANGQLLFDGTALDTSLSREIIRRMKTGEKGWKSMVRFLEKVMENQSERSRQALYAWVTDVGLTITKSGDMVMYKGVNNDGSSVFDGYAIVNGEPFTGHVPNEVGSVIEFPREQIDSDAQVACSVGLHCGTYSYASGFGQRLLTVVVNPRDVVSVPDHAKKVRVCRYRITDIGPEAPFEQGTIGDYDDECENCGDSESYCDCWDQDEEGFNCDGDCGYACTCESDTEGVSEATEVSETDGEDSVTEVAENTANGFYNL